MPPSKCFIYLNPIQIQFDVDSCLWFASFGLGLQESLMQTNVADSIDLSSSSTEPSLMYMDFKMEAIMPRVMFESPKDVPLMQRDRPKTMQVQVSRFAVTNIREMGASRADLAQAIHTLQEGQLVFSTGFPSTNEDLNIVTDRILAHVAATDCFVQAANAPNSMQTINHLSRYALWNDTRDVWCIKIDPVWIEFLGISSIGVNKAIPFMDAVPITLWIHGKSEIDDSIFAKMSPNENGFLKTESYSNESKTPNEMILSVQSLANVQNETQQQSDQHVKTLLPEEIIKKISVDDKSADVHIIAHFENLVSIMIDHYQFLFLMRFLEDINELTTFLSIDSKRILKSDTKNRSVIFGCVIPQVEATLVMPSQTPGKESSGGDGESIIPDSISLAGDLHTKSSGWNQGSLSIDSQSRVLNALSSIESPSPLKEKIENSLESKSNIKFNIPENSESSEPNANNRTDSPTSSSSISTLKNKKISGDPSTISKEINSGLSQMRKGFTNFMTSIETVVKTNASFDDGSDTISIQSDFSDDSELFTVLADTDKATTDCNDFMFKLNPFTTESKIAPVEVASEVCEDPYLTNASSPSEPSDASSLRRRDLVSMVTFRYFHSLCKL